MNDTANSVYFRFFNEIGIINQLSVTLFEAKFPDGVLMSHFSVLNHLIRVGDGKTPLELSSAFQVPKTTMTHTLSGLAKLGFVDLRPNPEDGRSKQVWITEAGTKFRNESIGMLAEELEQFSASFPPWRLSNALQLLEEVRIYLDEARN